MTDDNSNQWDGYTERRREHGWETRLIRLEVTIENFSHSIAKHIDDHATALKSLSDDLKGLRPPLGEIVKVALSALAVGLVIIGMVGKVSVVDPHNDLARRVSLLEIARGLHEDGHPKRILDLLALYKEDLEELKQAIRRPPLVGDTPQEPMR